MSPSYIGKCICLEELLSKQESLLKVILGDKNSKYFHRKFNWRRRRNKILAMQNDTGNWVEDNDDIANISILDWKAIMTFCSTDNQILIQELFQPIVTDEGNDWLVSIPSHEEFFCGSKISKCLEGSRTRWI